MEAIDFLHNVASRPPSTLLSTQYTVRTPNDRSENKRVIALFCNFRFKAVKESSSLRQCWMVLSSFCRARAFAVIYDDMQMYSPARARAPIIRFVNYIQHVWLDYPLTTRIGKIAHFIFILGSFGVCHVCVCTYLYLSFIAFSHYSYRIGWSAESIIPRCRWQFPFRRISSPAEWGAGHKNWLPHMHNNLVFCVNFEDLECRNSFSCGSKIKCIDFPSPRAPSAVHRKFATIYLLSGNLNALHFRFAVCKKFKLFIGTSANESRSIYGAVPRARTEVAHKIGTTWQCWMKSE